MALVAIAMAWYLRGISVASLPEEPSLSVRPSCGNSVDALHYFPVSAWNPQRSTADDQTHEYYANFLRAMGEPSLSCGAGANDAYRVTRLEHTGVPVTVRIARTASGIQVSSTKLEAPTWNLPPGDIVDQRHFETSIAAWDFVAAALERADFWRLPTSQHRGAPDGPGTAWIIEARRGQSYHVVVKASPPKGAFRDLGVLILSVGGVTERELAGDAPGVKARPDAPQPGFPPPPPPPSPPS